MKNNTRRSLFTVGAFFGVLVVLGLYTDLFVTGGTNELSVNGKQIDSPAVPLVLSQNGPASAPSTKKVIRTLKISPYRTLVLFGEVEQNAELLARDVTRLSKQSKEPIVLLIDSPGGSVFSGEKLVSAIEASRADVYTVCVGMCASMAAIIHQYGTKRLATDRSILMFHDAAAMVGGRVSEMLSILNMIQRKLEKTNHYIANRSGIPYNDLIRLESSNFWVDAEDALQLKLVDGLVVVEE